jgi:hypothetical protein
MAIVLDAAMDVAPLRAAASDDAFLKRIAGEWRGNGRVRVSAGAARERVSCQMTASWQDGSRRLSMNFDCRGVDFEFASSGFLTSLQQNNYIEGQWRGGGRVGQSTVIGRRNGNSVSLTVTSRDAHTGEQLTGTFTLRLSNSDNKLVNTIRGEDSDTGQQYTVLSLTMRR